MPSISQDEPLSVNSRLHDVGNGVSVDAARVHDERGVLQDEIIVDDAVVRDEKSDVSRSQHLGRERARRHGRQVRPAPHLRGHGHVGVVIADDRAQHQELVDHLERGALPRVIDVLLVGKPEDEDLRALDRPAAIVERRL